MTFKLIKESNVVKDNTTFVIKLYFDSDTNTQRHEYVLNDYIFYFLEYECMPYDEAEIDLSIESIVNGFNDWYDQFGIDWINNGKVF